MGKLSGWTRWWLALLSFKAKNDQFTYEIKIKSYGEKSCYTSKQEIKTALQHLFKYCADNRCYGTHYLICYNSATSYSGLEEVVKRGVERGIRREQLMFAYQCGEYLTSAPVGYSWYLIQGLPLNKFYLLWNQQGEQF